MVTLGSKVTDKITGFTGVVTGYVQYLTGCNQALVQPPVSKDGAMVDSVWVDAQRLVVDKKVRPVVLANAASPGSDKPAPRR